jgi:hypothetical protein
MEISGGKFSIGCMKLRPAIIFSYSLIKMSEVNRPAEGEKLSIESRPFAAGGFGGIWKGK